MIKFRYVRFKNFGSFGNYYTEIDFNKGQQVLVAGNNGNGKSFALLDSITFGLFGRPFRKVNIPQLVNSINEKDCEVQVEFSNGKHEYKIVRGMKPKKFEIYKNGKLLDQNAKAKDYQKMLEEQILKMNYKTFTQVVILGSSSFIPFMQLSASDRREVIEDILDIQIFSVMNGLLKARITQQKESLREVQYNIDLLEEKCEVQKEYLKKVQNNADANIEKNLDIVKEETKAIEELQQTIKDLSEEIDDIVVDTEQLKTTKQKIKTFEDLKSKMEGKQSTHQRDLDFYQNNDSCPKCTQKITKRLKETMTNVASGELHILSEGLEKMETQLSSLYTELDAFAEIEMQVAKLQKQVSGHQSKIDSINNYISKVNGQTKELIEGKKNIKTEIEKEEEYRDNLNEQTNKKIQLVEDRHYADIAYTLLKDNGIKAKIIKAYLPVINKLINKYLAAMDFFAKFNLDENFNETIKSRHRDDFSYMSFSEGEKMRIDLALLLTWREIARLKNSANTNLLILDEVFDSSLDSFGTDEFLRLLHTVSGSTNVFVISHKADQLVDKFQEYITFEKKNDFSHMKR
tara:strand:- start:1223 stop:2941 length:1719 start_codon:yes stop_codon:yes gene_type:complete